MSLHSKEKVYTKRPLCVVYYGVDFSFDGRQGGLNFDSCSFACTVRENQVWKATIESCRFWEEDDYGYEIVSVLIIVLLREPTSLWRENVKAVIILLRVLAREGREGTLRNEEAYELTTFARRRRWTAWQAYCACLSGHLPASRQRRRCCWQRFASVLEKAGRETTRASRFFLYISLPSLRDYDVKWPKNLSFFWGRERQGVKNSTICVWTKLRPPLFSSNINFLLLSNCATRDNRQMVWKDAESIFKQDFPGRRRCRIVRSPMS